MCARQWTRPLKRLVNFISVVILFSLFFFVRYVITQNQRFFFLFCVCMNYKYSLHIVSVQDEAQQLVLALSNDFYLFVMMMMISTQMQVVIQQQQQRQQKLRDANWNAPLYISVVMDLRPNKILFNIKIGFRLHDDDDGDEFIKRTNYSMFQLVNWVRCAFKPRLLRACHDGSKNWSSNTVMAI